MNVFTNAKIMQNIHSMGENNIFYNPCNRCNIARRSFVTHSNNSIMAFIDYYKVLGVSPKENKVRARESAEQGEREDGTASDAKEIL